MTLELVYIGLIILAVICTVVFRKITDSNIATIIYLLYAIAILFIVYELLFIFNPRFY